MSYSEYAHENRERKEPQQAVVRTCMPPSDDLRWGDMAQYLFLRRLPFDVAVANGWYPSTHAGDREARIVIPATNTAGFVFWQARAMGAPPNGVQSQRWLRYQSPHGVPRLDSVVLVWPNVVWTGAAAIVEGPMDALAAAGAGAIGVGLMGAQPPMAVCQFVARRLAGWRVLAVADSDALQAAARTVGVLASLGLASSLVLVPSPAKDLAELGPQERKELLG